MNVPFLLAALDEALSPARLELLAKQFGIDPMWVEHCAAADPTDGKYMTWILKQWKAGKLRFPEDSQKVHERLSQFAKLSRTSTWTAPKDLNQYKSFADVVRAVEIAAPGKKQAVRAAQETGVELIAERGELLLYKVTTPEAGAKIFRHTEWCVKDPAYFNDYGPPFYYLANHDEPFKLLHFDPYQCMDVLDEPTSFDEFEVLGIDVTGEIMKSPTDSSKYAVSVMKSRWPSAEPIIATDGKAAIEYAMHLIPGRWPEAEAAILKDADPGSYLAHVKRTLGKDNPPPEWPDWHWPEAEAQLLAWVADPETLEGGDKYSIDGKARSAAVRGVNYTAQNGARRWPELEPFLLEPFFPDVVAEYIRKTDGSRWPEAEAVYLERMTSVMTGSNYDSQIQTLCNGVISYIRELQPPLAPDDPFINAVEQKLTAILAFEYASSQGGSGRRRIDDYVRMGIGPLVRLYRDIMGFPFQEARARAEAVLARIENQP